MWNISEAFCQGSTEKQIRLPFKAVGKHSSVIISVFAVLYLMCGDKKKSWNSLSCRSHAAEAGGSSAQ